MQVGSKGNFLLQDLKKINIELLIDYFIIHNESSANVAALFLLMLYK